MAIPEVRRQRQHAGVEQVGIVERLVVLVVLGRQAQGARLDAHVDVFRHQHHLALALVLLAQRLHDTEDLVVGLALRQAGRQLVVHQLRLEEQLAVGFLVTGLVERDAGLAVERGAVGCERVQVAADLAGIARDFAHALLVVVEFLERDHRQVDVVLVEAEQRSRVVHQHVGVEHEQLRWAFVHRLAGLARARFGCLRGHRGCSCGGRLGLHGGAGRGGVVELGHRWYRGLRRRRGLQGFLGGAWSGLGFEFFSGEKGSALCRRLGKWHGVDGGWRNTRLSSPCDTKASAEGPRPARSAWSESKKAAPDRGGFVRDARFTTHGHDPLCTKRDAAQ